MIFRTKISPCLLNTRQCFGIYRNIRVVQGTFETLSAIALKKYNNTLEGRVYLTAGGMGSNQSWAMKMHGGVQL